MGRLDARTGLAGFVTMMVFIAEFVVGFWYIWKKGALDWE
jgi:NADH-quinone oxidoreductase subunit A